LELVEGEKKSAPGPNIAEASYVWKETTGVTLRLLSYVVMEASGTNENSVR
jgi:hypothetical protein